MIGFKIFQLFLQNILENKSIFSQKKNMTIFEEKKEISVFFNGINLHTELVFSNKKEDKIKGNDFSTTRRNFVRSYGTHPHA